MKIRRATREDVPAVVALLADDPLGAAREGAGMEAYLAAFEEIAANPMHQLLVGEEDGRIVATLQLTILAGLSRAARGVPWSRRSAWRPTGAARGWAKVLMAEAEDRARAAGCRTSS